MMPLSRETSYNSIPIVYIQHNTLYIIIFLDLTPHPISLPAKQVLANNDALSGELVLCDREWKTSST